MTYRALAGRIVVCIFLAMVVVAAVLVVGGLLARGIVWVLYVASATKILYGLMGLMVLIAFVTLVSSIYDSLYGEVQK